MLLGCAALVGYVPSTWPPELISSVVLRKAVLQAATYTPRATTAKVSRNLVETWNGLGFTSSLSQEMILTDAACIHEDFQHLYTFIPCIFIYSQVYFQVFSIYGNTSDLVFMFLFFVSARE